MAKKTVQTKPVQTVAKTTLKSVAKATSKAAAATPPRGSIQTTWVQPKKKA